MMGIKMKQIGDVLLCLAVVLFCSCGEFFNFETEQPHVEGLRMSHHEVDLIVGDSLTFGVELVPDTIPVSYYWLVKGDEEAIELAGRKVNALKPGQALVVVQAQRVNGDTESIADSCYVNVFGWKEVSNDEFLYETVVYCSLVVDGVAKTADMGDTRLAAVVDGELRGMAVMREEHGVPYLELRIRASWPGETASIECYDPNASQRFVIEELLLNGETYGTLSDLKRYRCKSRNYGN
ncbi:MAG: hypothetical protein IJF06_02525 [Bacteroidaceae bacterium]|nr:hypothetical protein [Bacteroidaceae bacterium]